MKNTRNFISRRAFVATAASAAACASLPNEPQEQATDGSDDMPVQRRPNVLVILADQHRTDCLRCYGNPDVRTPHLDALAADGVRYTDSFCPFPVCTPSRYSLLSGRYVHEHCGWNNRCTLPPGTETFPSILRAAGYRTAAVGKMHFTPTYLDVGFERLILAEQDGAGRWDDDYHRDLREAGLVDANDLEDQRSEYRAQARPEYWRNLGALPSNLPAEYHSTEWIAKHALNLLEEWGPEGNLLMVGFIKPHHPFDPPKEWCEAYDPDKVSLRPGWIPELLPWDAALHKGYFPNAELTEASLRRATAYYYATIEHMDVQIGRMIDLLKRKGLYDNTLIVYTSDHGEYLGYHHLLLKGNYMYDPLMRVPLLIKYPGQGPTGEVAAALVSNVDVAPTLLNAVSCRPAATMRGHDLRAHREGRDMIFAEGGRGGQEMVQTRQWKLLRTNTPDTDLLFDLTKDPLEMRNRFGDPACRDEQLALEKALDEWRGPGPMSEVYLDENAPVIEQPNVLRHNDGHRDAIIAYYAEKMAEWRAGQAGAIPG